MKTFTVLFLLLAVISCLLLAQYLYYLNDYHPAPVNAPPKTILYWTKMFDRDDFNLGLGSSIFQGCEVSNCYATNDKRYMPVDQFDAVLFHANDFYYQVHRKPENRSSKQYYVYVNQESPVYSTPWRGPHGFFNWTMTYRFDSDIPRPYGYYKPLAGYYEMPTVADVEKKPHKIAWMVSNCHSMSERNAIYEKLSSYFPIHVYGNCGNYTCPREEFDKCYDLLARNYKFYLAFENSICTEYVTEKMYAALIRDIVPIVYGGADYAKVAPPHSVIDVAQFGSVEELAGLITFLDENPEQYLLYFEWKEKYVVRTDSNQTLCSLCKKLHEPFVRKCYIDIQKWWEYGMCESPNRLPKMVLYT